MFPHAPFRALLCKTKCVRTVMSDGSVLNLGDEPWFIHNYWRGASFKPLFVSFLCDSELLCHVSRLRCSDLLVHRVLEHRGRSRGNGMCPSQNKTRSRGAPKLFVRIASMCKISNQSTNCMKIKLDYFVGSFDIAALLS